MIEGSCKCIAEVLLWLLFSLGLCCGIVDEFPAYMAGKIVSQPELLCIYIAYNTQMDSPDIDILLQKNSYRFFYFGQLDFQYEDRYSIPCDMIYYTLRFRDAALAIRIKCVGYVNPCGPRSNLNFIHFLWTTFVFYVMNYGMIIVPSRAAGDRLLYVHHHRAEIEGDDSRACNRCL